MYSSMQLDGRTKTENSMAEHKFVQLCMSYGSNIFQLPREIRKEKNSPLEHARVAVYIRVQCGRSIARMGGLQEVHVSPSVHTCLHS